VGRVCSLGGQASSAGQNTFLWGRVKKSRGHLLYWGRARLIGAPSIAVGHIFQWVANLFLSGLSYLLAEGRINSLGAELTLLSGDSGVRIDSAISGTEILLAGRVLCEGEVPHLWLSLPSIWGHINAVREAEIKG